jgi:hypothetical protein
MAAVALEVVGGVLFLLDSSIGAILLVLTSNFGVS